MVITVDKKELGEAVAQVARFAERRSATLPVLAGIALIAGDDGIKLRATNLETGIDRKLEGSIQTPGVVALPAQTLHELTASLSGSGTVTFEHGGDTVVVSSATGKSTLKTLPYEDFPTLPFPQSPIATFSLPGASLRSLITSVAGCASPSTVRPELASVFLSSEGGMIQAVATDSFRLTEKRLPLTGTIAPFSILIPAKNAVDMAQTIPDDDVEIRFDEHQCVFSWSRGMVTSRLVTVSYPDYRQIIPKSFTSEATLLRKDFEAALRRTAVFSDTFQKVRLGFDSKQKTVTLAAHNNDVGESADSIPAAITGDDIELSFNHRYLQAPLSLITSESISLSAAGIGRPLVIRGVGDSSLLYLVMPMNQ